MLEELIQAPVVLLVTLIAGLLVLAVRYYLWVGIGKVAMIILNGMFKGYELVAKLDKHFAFWLTFMLYFWAAATIGAWGLILLAFYCLHFYYKTNPSEEN
jgi:hypothetical protein